MLSVDFYTHSYITFTHMKALAPLHRKEDTVQDKLGIDFTPFPALLKDRRYGSSIKFYQDVPKILNEISSFQDTRIAVCSRTHAPAL